MTKTTKTTKTSKKSKQLIAKMSKQDYAKIAKSGKAETVGQFIRALLVQGKMETAQIVEKARKSFKGSKTKPSDVYWNASQLRKQGLLA